MRYSITSEIGPTLATVDAYRLSPADPDDELSQDPPRTGRYQFDRATWILSQLLPKSDPWLYSIKRAGHSDHGMCLNGVYELTSCDQD